MQRSLLAPGAWDGTSKDVAHIRSHLSFVKMQSEQAFRYYAPDTYSPALKVPPSKGFVTVGSGPSTLADAGRQLTVQPRSHAGEGLHTMDRCWQLRHRPMRTCRREARVEAEAEAASHCAAEVGGYPRAPRTLPVTGLRLR